MTNPYSNHLRDFIYGEPVAKSRKVSVKARVLPELNVKPLRAFASVKKVNANTEKTQTASLNNLKHLMIWR